MKLNRKGYLTVEVILASVIAVTIAFFLMEITIKLVNVTDDAYVNTELLTDKTLIIKNIKGQLEKNIKEEQGIKNVNCNNNSCQITFCSAKTSNILITNDNVIKYNDYEKKLNSILNEIKLVNNGSTDTSGYLLFKLTADNKFSKKNFEANIIVYNSKACE